MQAYTEATKLAFGRRAAELIHTYFIDPVFLGVRKLTKALDDMPTSLKIAAGALTLFSGSFAFKWLFQVAKAVLVFKLGVKALNFTMSRSVAVAELVEKGFLKAGTPIDKLILSSGKLTASLTEGALASAKTKAALAGLAKSATVWENILRASSVGTEFLADLMIQGSKAEKFFRAKSVSMMTSAQKIFSEGGAAVGQRWYKGIVDFFPKNKLIDYTKKVFSGMFDAGEQGFGGIKGLFAARLSSWTELLAPIKWLGKQGSDLLFKFSKGWLDLPVFAEVGKAIGSVAKETVKTSLAFETMGFVGQHATGMLSAGFTNLFSSISKNAVKFGKWIGPVLLKPWVAIPLAIGALSITFDGFWDKFKKGLNYVADLMMELPSIITEMALGIPKLLDFVVDSIASGLSSLWDNLLGPAKEGGKVAAESFGTSFLSIVGKLIYGVGGSIVSFITNSIVESAGLIVSAGFGIAKLLLIGVMKPLGMLWTLVTEKWSQSHGFADFMVSLASTFAQGLGALAEKAWNAIRDYLLIPLAGAVMQPFIKLYAYIAERAADFLDTLAPYMSWFGGLADEAKDAAGFLRKQVQAANDSISVIKQEELKIDEKSAALSHEKVDAAKREAAIRKAAGNDEAKRFMTLQMKNRTFLNTGGNILQSRRRRSPNPGRKARGPGGFKPHHDFVGDPPLRRRGAVDHVAPRV
jgi:hypothetical protein